MKIPCSEVSATLCDKKKKLRSVILNRPTCCAVKPVRLPQTRRPTVRFILPSQ